jgi:hypothetical protein
VAIGAYSLEDLIHGSRNVAVGAYAGGSLYGNSTLKATAEVNSTLNVFVGYESASTLTSGVENVIVGARGAANTTGGSENTGLGYGVWANGSTGPPSVSRSVAVGYKAGYLNTTGLTNTMVLGPLAGGLRASNTAKIGNALTDVTVSGRLMSGRSVTSISTASGVTLTAAQIVEGLITRTGAGPYTDTTPTAALIVAAIPGAEVGSSFEFIVTNGMRGALTISGGTGVTISSAEAVIPAGYSREFIARVTNATTSSEAVTITGKQAIGGFRKLGEGTATLTGTLTPTVLASVTIPGRPGGRTGIIRITTLWGLTNNANGKAPSITYGGTAFWAPAASSQANIGALRPPPADIAFTGASSQVGFALASNVGSSSSALVTATVDSTVDQTLEIVGTLSNAGDTMTLGYWRVDELP